MSLTHIINMPVTGQLPAGPHASAVYTVDSPQGPLVFKVYKHINDGAAREYATATSAKTTPSLDVPSLATPAGAGHIEGEGMWVAYKKVDGPLLSEIASTLTPAEGVELLLALTEAVLTLHGTGTFHHNIAPHQVRVVNGAPVLLDVGYFWSEASVRPSTAAQDIKGLISVAQVLPLTAAVQSAATRLKPSIVSYRDALMKAKVRDETFLPEKHEAPAGGLPTAPIAAPAPMPAPAPVEPEAPAEVPAPVEAPTPVVAAAAVEGEPPTVEAEEPSEPAEATAPVEEHTQASEEPAPETPAAPVAPTTSAPSPHAHGSMPAPTSVPTPPVVVPEPPAPAPPAVEVPQAPVEPAVEQVSRGSVPILPASTPVPDPEPAPAVEESSEPQVPVAPIATPKPPAPAVEAAEANEIPSEPEASLPTRKEPPAPAEPDHEDDEDAETPAQVRAKKPRRKTKPTPEQAASKKAPARGAVSRRTALTAGGVLAAALLAGGGYLAYQKIGGTTTAAGLTDKLTTVSGETKSGIEGYSTQSTYSIPITEDAKVFASEAAIAVQNGTSLDLYSSKDGKKIRTVDVPDDIQTIRESKIGDEPALLWKTGTKIVAYTANMGEKGDLITIEKSADTKLLDAGQRPMLLEGSKVYEVTAEGAKQYTPVAGSTPIAIDREGLISGSYDGPVSISSADGTVTRTVELTAPGDGWLLHGWVYAGNGLTATVWSQDVNATDAKTSVRFLVHRLSDGAIASDVPMTLGQASEAERTWITGQGALEATYGSLVFNVARGELVSELPEGWKPVRVKGSHVIAEDATGARLIFSGANPGYAFNGALLAQVSTGVIVQKGNAITGYPSTLL